MDTSQKEILLSIQAIKEKLDILIPFEIIMSISDFIECKSNNENFFYKINQILRNYRAKYDRESEEIGSYPKDLMVIFIETLREELANFIKKITGQITSCKSLSSPKKNLTNNKNIEVASNQNDQGKNQLIENIKNLFSKESKLFFALLMLLSFTFSYYNLEPILGKYNLKNINETRLFFKSQMASTYLNSWPDFCGQAEDSIPFLSSIFIGIISPLLNTNFQIISEFISENLIIEFIGIISSILYKMLPNSYNILEILIRNIDKINPRSIENVFLGMIQSNTFMQDLYFLNVLSVQFYNDTLHMIDLLIKNCKEEFIQEFVPSLLFNLPKKLNEKQMILKMANFIFCRFESTEKIDIKEEKLYLLILNNLLVNNPEELIQLFKSKLFKKIFKIELVDENSGIDYSINFDDKNKNIINNNNNSNNNKNQNQSQTEIINYPEEILLDEFEEPLEMLLHLIENIKEIDNYYLVKVLEGIVPKLFTIYIQFHTLKNSKEKENSIISNITKLLQYFMINSIKATQIFQSRIFQFINTYYRDLNSLHESMFKNYFEFNTANSNSVKQLSVNKDSKNEIQNETNKKDKDIPKNEIVEKIIHKKYSYSLSLASSGKPIFLLQKLELIEYLDKYFQSENIERSLDQIEILLNFINFLPDTVKTIATIQLFELSMNKIIQNESEKPSETEDEKVNNIQEILVRIIKSWKTVEIDITRYQAMIKKNEDESKSIKREIYDMILKNLWVKSREILLINFDELFKLFNTSIQSNSDYILHECLKFLMKILKRKEIPGQFFYFLLINKERLISISNMSSPIVAQKGKKILSLIKIDELTEVNPEIITLPHKKIIEENIQKMYLEDPRDIFSACLNINSVLKKFAIFPKPGIKKIYKTILYCSRSNSLEIINLLQDIILNLSDFDINYIIELFLNDVARIIDENYLSWLFKRSESAKNKTDNVKSNHLKIFLKLILRNLKSKVNNDLITSVLLQYSNLIQQIELELNLRKLAINSYCQICSKITRYSIVSIDETKIISLLISLSKNEEHLLPEIAKGLVDILKYSKKVLNFKEQILDLLEYFSPLTQMDLNRDSDFYMKSLKELIN